MDLAVTLFTVAAALGASWLRMGAALLLSIGFSLAVGVAAATNRYLERVIIPVLDILQSIPILGFFPLALAFFYRLSPLIGGELAAVFLVFTSQVWNITFAVYETTKVISTELLDTARALRMNLLDRFRYIYVPATFPRITQNLQPSWANGIFFLVGSEIISFGEEEVKLFGLGTVMSDFTVNGDIIGVGLTLLLLVAATVATNLLVFTPLIEATQPQWRPVGRFTSLVYPLRRLFGGAVRTVRIQPLLAFAEYHTPVTGLVKKLSPLSSIARGLAFFVTGGVVLGLIVSGGETLLARIALFTSTLNQIGVETLGLATLYSLLRVSAAVCFALAWSVPASILIAHSKRFSTMIPTLFQVIASIPATIVYPIFANTLADFPELRAFILVVAASQWYVFFQVLAGVRGVPVVEEDVSRLLGLSFAERVRFVYLPRALPSLITGCITAAGGAWNALVVAERLDLGNVVAETELPGLGKLLSIYTYEGNLAASVVVITVMASVIVLMNRLFWKALYAYAVSKLKIEETGQSR
jgi:NitT/TauT family transport system permease protein